jgi:hypothetical protein
LLTCQPPNPFNIVPPTETRFQGPIYPQDNQNDLTKPELGLFSNHYSEATLATSKVRH